jgi:hypothetical protein
MRNRDPQITSVTRAVDGPGAPGVEQALRVRDIDVFRSLVHLGDQPERAVRERGDDQYAFGRQVELDLFAAQAAVDAHVGEAEGQRERVAGVVAEAGEVADPAVHAVGRHDVPGGEGFAGVEGDGRVVVVLGDAGGGTRAAHCPAELLEPIEQHLLGVVLRNHQGVRIPGRQSAERDADQLAAAVADAEARRRDPERDQAVADADPLQHLQRPGVHDSRPRGVGALGQLVEHHHLVARSRQHDAHRQTDRPSSDHHDVRHLDLLSQRLLTPTVGRSAGQVNTC